MGCEEERQEVSLSHTLWLHRTEACRCIALGKEMGGVGLPCRGRLYWERVACNQGSHDQVLSKY